MLSAHVCQPPRAHVSFRPTPQPKGGLGGAATFYRRGSQLERRQHTDQETGARDGKTLFVEVGAAEEQEHIGLVLLPVLSKDLGELPQLR